MSPTAKAGDTKERILRIAAQLFAHQGYTGTSIADIARELGTTTAALYYHFPSKADILAGLLAEPMKVYEQVLGSLTTGRPTAEELLNEFIDLAVDSRELATIIDKDPAVLAMIDKQLPRSSEEMTAEVIGVVAAPGADRAAIIRAHAAFAVVKAATMAALATGDGVLTDTDRAEILTTALRALRP